MNNRMPFWLSTQNSFRELEATLAPLVSGYVYKVSLVVESSQSQGNFDWKCEIKTASSNFRMTLDWADTRSAAFTCLTEGFYEPQLEEVLVETLMAHKEAKGRGTFLDIGANEGFHTLNCLIAEPDFTAIAFEPNPVARTKLEENLRENSLTSRCKVWPFALGRGPGLVNFHIPAITGTGGGSLMDLHPEEGAATVIEVEVISLDSLQIEPSVIKIDVEGNELNVLMGAQDTLKASRPFIVVELLRKWMRAFGHHPQDVVNLLLNLDYEVYAIKSNSIKKISVIDAQTEETNFLFSPKEAMLSSWGRFAIDE